MKKLFNVLLIAVLAGFMLAGCDHGTGSNPATVVKEDVKPENGNGIYDDSALSSATVYVVGDSTVCNYIKADGSFTDSSYFYPRYGYATQFSNYLSSKITVNNLALSGRSSKSFLAEENYTTLKNSIKAGDFLVIGFGHNDEKSDDPDRFADASKSTETEGSFKYNLYNYYCKIALDAGATPILCSPICRVSSSNDYSGSNGHVTGATGDYGQAVIDLGTEKNIQVVDLRGITKAIYTELGYSEAIFFHAMTTGTSDTEPKVESVDTTHINIYGAKRIAYEFAKVIQASSCALAPYVDTTKLVVPAKATDLVKNPNYKYVAYSPVNWPAYTPISRFTTITSGWYGTAFGDCGGDPTTESKDFIAKETSAGIFRVGQGDTATSQNGKITGSTLGTSLVFTQLPVSRNFTLTAEAKVIKAVAGKTQAGFGLMLRDDCYIPTNDKSIASNLVTAGMYIPQGGTVNVNFAYESGKLVNSDTTLTSEYAANDTVTLTIKRLGQVVTVTTVFKDQTYTKTFTDFDFVAKDTEYFYAGMFATRGTVVEFTDVVLTDDGESQGA
jgi:lysophospholipase L1-like esterase